MEGDECVGAKENEKKVPQISSKEGKGEESVGGETEIRRTEGDGRRGKRKLNKSLNEQRKIED